MFREIFSKFRQYVAPPKPKPTVQQARLEHQMRLVKFHIGIPQSRFDRFKEFCKELKPGFMNFGASRQPRKFVVRRLIKGKSLLLKKSRTPMFKDLALKRLLNELNLYHLEFKGSPKLKKDKALVFFHPHFTPSKIKMKQLLKETIEDSENLRKEAYKNWISGLVIVCSLIEQASKPASFSHHIYALYRREAKEKGGWAALLNMGKDALGLLERSNMKGGKESMDKLTKILKDATTVESSVNALKSAACDLG